ncbi:MAG: phenylalanine--tRNA ligase subunit alpha [Candidatus Aenigmarchaeota archaeon]|nr:phenylalanine--tRNA ligase subunit alpha [Candidatus Aenigmarchaeota archaeon]
MQEKVAYGLTEEGKKYLEEGLPERNLLNLISKGKVPFEEAKRLENFNIALQWAKKSSWIFIDGGFLSLSPEGKAAIEKGKSVLEEALSNAEKQVIPSEMASLLLKRNLIRKLDARLEDVKKLKGKEVLSLTPELIKTGMWKEVKFKEYNVGFTGKKLYPGKRHPYRVFLKNLKTKLINLGFEEMDSRIIMQDFWNCDVLFMPQTHSARDIHEIFNVDAKIPLVDRSVAEKVGKEHEKYWGYKWDYGRSNSALLMSQGTALSASHLPNLKIPGKYFSLAKVFRPDVVDATHLLEFYQLEGIVCDKSMNFRHLLGLLKQFAIDIAGAEAVKFYPDYFPFTEPSVQISAKHPKLGWVELGGAGIFRKQVTRPFGIEEPIIAWGLGIDRLAMFNLGVTDIRELYSSNLKWLRENYYYAKD